MFDLQRLKADKNLTQTQIAEIIGVQQGYVSRILKGMYELSGDHIRMLCEVLNVNSDDYAVLNVDALPTINYLGKGVPYYNVDFIGGFDIVLNDQTANPECYIEFPAYDRADMWANITGKSMEPLISHGDMIALRRVEDWDTYMLYGEIYGIVTDEYRTVKKVRTSKKGDDFLRLVPMNEQFDEQDIPKSIVRAVFQIIGCAKRIF